MKDTAWVLYNVLMKRVENRTGITKTGCIDFKNFTVICTIDNNFIRLALAKDNEIKHDIMFNDFNLMNHLFIQNETVKNILMTYIEIALSTLTEKEITEIFNSYYGEQAIHV